MGETSRAAAVKEAADAVRLSKLPDSIKVTALQNLDSQTFTTYTVATGNSKNSVVFSCVNKVCK